MDNALREKYRKELYSCEWNEIERQIEKRRDLINALSKRLAVEKQELASMEHNLSAEKARIEKIVDLKVEAYEQQIKDHEQRMQNDSAYAEKYNLAKEFNISYQSMEENAEHLLPILKTLKQNQLISAESLDWLNNEGKTYFTRRSKIYETYCYIYYMQGRSISLTSEKQVVDAVENNALTEKSRSMKAVDVKTEHRNEQWVQNDSVHEEKRILAKEFNVCHQDLEENAEYLLPILRKLKQNQRISAEDEAWLTTKGKAYFNRGEKIYEKHHYIQAQYHLERYRKHQDFWSLVNASSHFRKANSPRIILPYLEAVPLFKIHKVPAKQQSALFTTFGGVKRDVGLSKEALELAHQGHEKNPSDYRPCTLLGALYIECGQYEEGTKWFDKAEALGAPKDSADRELRGIYHKAGKEEKERLKAYLLGLDSKRYAWCRK